MTTLWLTEDQARAIIHHALTEAPKEACGIIAGRGIRAEQIFPIPNVAPDPITRYSMEPKAQFEAMRAIENDSLSILGFYHSHPKGKPIPSETDIREAYYGDIPYLIVGLKNNPPTMAAWIIHKLRVTPAALHIGIELPEIHHDEGSLSRAQVIAIIASAFIALVIMLILSINLLPPAPPIP